MSNIGRLTVKDHERWLQRTGQFLRVFVHGIDVTNRCRFADDEHQVAEVYCRDEDGHDWRVGSGAIHVTPDGGEEGPHVYYLTGGVEIRA